MTVLVKVPGRKPPILGETPVKVKGSKDLRVIGVKGIYLGD